jgi:simple sugar transport system permease protein
MDTLAQLVILTLAAGTPLVFAALGELVTEKSGVLNLGVEGMMLVGAVVAFMVAVEVGLAVARLRRGHRGRRRGVDDLRRDRAYRCWRTRSPPASALSFFGVGLSAFIGLDYVSVVIDGIKPLAIRGLSDLPVVGQLLFGHSPLVYLSFVLFAAVHLFLDRTRAGLVLRAVGESPHSAHAIGYPVIAIRYAAVFFGGACAGLAGAYLSVAYTPLWVEGWSPGAAGSRWRWSCSRPGSRGACSPARTCSAA